MAVVKDEMTLEETKRQSHPILKILDLKFQIHAKSNLKRINLPQLIKRNKSNPKMNERLGRNT